MLEGFPKAQGMMLALRSLNPRVLVTDEIGTQADADALREAVNCGVAVVASLRGQDRKGSGQGGVLAYDASTGACVIVIVAAIAFGIYIMTQK